MGFFSSRRNNIVEEKLRKMISKGVQEADFSDLYFDAACKYAQDNGGKLYDDMRDSIIFDKVFDGENYSVLFHIGRGGRGTNVTLNKRRDSYELAKQEAEEFVRIAKGQGASSDRAETMDVLPFVLESFQQKKIVRARPAAQVNMNKFFQAYATSIPSKSISDEVGLVRFGLLDIPGAGVLAVLGAVINGELIVSAPGTVERQNLSTQTAVLLAWQDEALQTYHSAFREEAEKTARTE